MKKCIAFFLLVCLCLTGCQAQPDNGETTAPETTVSGDTVQTETQQSELDPEELFSNKDRRTDYEQEDYETVLLAGDTATATCDITLSEGTVTLTAGGTYLLQGTLTDGTLIVDTDKSEKVWLILDGVSISSADSAAIYIRQADKVFITLAPDSVNTLTGGDSFVQTDDNNVDGVIFSKDDLTLNGSGTLKLQSPAGHGIVSKDDLRITGGTYEITAAGHGLCGKDALSVADGNFTVTAGKDGFHGENKDDDTLGNVYLGGGNYQITAEGDGVSAGAILQVDGGDYTVTTGGGSKSGETDTQEQFGGFGGWWNDQTATEEETASAKGMKSTGAMYLNGGTFQMDCADDCIHSNSNLTVRAGQYTLASGDDGFHADEALVIDDGTILVTNSYEGIEGLTVTVNGGDITVYADDDGLNAAGGRDGSGFGGFGGMGNAGWESMDGSNGQTGGNVPDKPEGNDPNALQTPDGEIPTMPEGGQMPDMPDGEMPTMPDNGQMPNMPDGEMPTMPEGGQMPDMPNGEIPAMANGAALEMTSNDQSRGKNDRPGNMGGFGNFGGDSFGSSSDCMICINGGTLRIYADGDGIDSNGSLQITGGYVIVEGPTDNGNSAIDYDGSGTISGGTVIASGSSGMAQSLTSTGTQGVLSVTTGNCSGGTAVSVTDETGNVILSFTPEKAFSCVVISSPDLKVGDSYTLQVGTNTKTVTAQ